MREFVTLTRADTLALFNKWDAEIAELGGADDPTPESRAEYFFDLADNYLNEKVK